MDAGPAELYRLAEVMHRLRTGCPWDASQTHESLVGYLVEEALETVEAIEAGTDDDLVEELGDLLLQVFFHSEIAAETGRFTVDDVAGRIADKLVSRHPYVFSEADVPEDLISSWERAKAAEKSRSSVLEGIPDRMSALTRAAKVLSRAASHGLEPDALVPPAADVAADQIGTALLALVARARELGVDPEQAARKSLRELEGRVRDVEAGL